MKRWAGYLGSLGSVERFDYPYAARGSRRPDPLPKLIGAHALALSAAKRKHSFDRVVLIGKSMGSRVGCHLAATEAVDAVVCLGYPLRAPTGKLRDRVLLDLPTRVLFVQGTRDALCPLDVLDSVRKKMHVESRLFVVEGGDHSLNVSQGALKHRATTQAAVDAEIVSAIAQFLKG
jgi:predicted alpha/beta-hydrolase family hydrolase